MITTLGSDKLSVVIVQMKISGQIYRRGSGYVPAVIDPLLSGEALDGHGVDARSMALAQTIVYARVADGWRQRACALHNAIG
ncbi:hypothetical protein AB672_01765 [Xylella taiwanensis]|nr:hypothetical protein AB672_01765 [Xylella taiwanensis]